jgi:hypothetical protein
MKSILWTLFVGICVVVGTAQARAEASICSMVTGNLVGNCGFETGDFTDWTLAGGLGGVNPNAGVEGQDPVDNLFPNSGDDQAWFSDLDVSPDWDVLTQNIATQAGGEYFVTFYLAQDTAPTPTAQGCTGQSAPECDNSVLVKFGGLTLLSQSEVPVQGYTKYTYQTVATSSSTTLSFTLGNGLGEFLLDDVSVVAPEPSAWTLMLLVTGGCVFLLKRRVSQGVAK